MFKKIVVGLDGSEQAERTLPYAAGLAKRDAAAVVLIHVEEDTIATGKGGAPLSVDEGEVRAKIAADASSLSDQGIKTSVRSATVTLGDVAPAISKLADEEDADLIVVGSHGRSALGSVMLGSVAHRLLRLARQPVLVVTSGARPEAQDVESEMAAA